MPLGHSSFDQGSETPKPQPSIDLVAWEEGWSWRLVTPAGDVICRAARSYRDRGAAELGADEARRLMSQAEIRG